MLGSDLTAEDYLFLVNSRTPHPDTVHAAISLWVTAMHTLLSSDWSRMKTDTPEQIWRCYCRMQNLALEFVPPQKLSELLALAKTG